MSRIVLPLCLLALACSNSGKLSSVETVDDTDTTDGSDGADVTDGSDGTDEADASDGADGSDGDDTADSGDTGSGEDPVVVLPDLTVDCEGSADFEEIQDAIEAADHGDIIAVLPSMKSRGVAPHEISPLGCVPSSFVTWAGSSPRTSRKI